MAKANNPKKVTNSAFANFKSELNMLFQDEIILKEHCRELHNLEEVFAVTHDRQKDQIVLSKGTESVPVAATYEVEKVAEKLAQKYKVPLIINLE